MNDAVDFPVEEDHNDGWNKEGAHGRINEEVGVEEATRAGAPVLRIVDAQGDGCCDGHRDDPRDGQHEKDSLGVFVFGVLDRLCDGNEPVDVGEERKRKTRVKVKNASVITITITSSE